jgi:hypothetical protein
LTEYEIVAKLSLDGWGRAELRQILLGWHVGT